MTPRLAHPDTARATRPPATAHRPAPPHPERDGEPTGNPMRHHHTRTTGDDHRAAPRPALACVVLAAAVPGLLFAPVFGPWALVPPIAAVALACLAAAELCLRAPALAPARPVLALVAGLLALTWTLLPETTSTGLPTVETARALLAGVTESWQLTLQSTWPARPDAELLLFVPMAVLVAAALGVELLRVPLVALLPGLAVLGLSQAYAPLTGGAAAAAGLVYAVVAGALLALPRPEGGSAGGLTRRVVALLPVLALAAVGAVVAGAVVPVGRQFSLHQDQAAPLPPGRVPSPLTEIAGKLSGEPDTPVFTYRSDVPVPRWRLAVLDAFDGVTWRTNARFQRMGAEVPPPAGIAAELEEHRASVRLLRPEGGWLPSQPMPVAVEVAAPPPGLVPAVDPASGMLRLPPDQRGPVDYELSWRDPRDLDLTRATIDPSALPPDAGLGVVPPGIAELAGAAVDGVRASLPAALALERYLRENYRLVDSGVLPTGSGWPQLRSFLLETKKGTSEQFAAAYVAMARMRGIPARVATGYQTAGAGAGEQVTVRDKHAFAWPEVAVTGVGWVPLDPTGKVSGGTRGGVEEATGEARKNLPPPGGLTDPALPLPGGPGGEGEPGPSSVPVIWLLLGLAALAAALVAGVPLWRAVRARRRRGGPPARAVAGAWAEARDLLRAHGVPWTPGMTVRDLARAAGPLLDRSTVEAVGALAGCVDAALWSGDEPGEQVAREAWEAVRRVRRGLARRPFPARLRAALDPRTLLPPATRALESANGLKSR